MTSSVHSHGPYLRAVLDAIPSLVFIVDSSMKVVDANSAAKDLFTTDTDFILKRLCGEVLHCLHQVDSALCCGQTEYCPDCVIRQAITASCTTHSIYRQKYKMIQEANGSCVELDYLVTVSPITYDDNTLFLLVLEDVTELLALRRLATLCSYCNSIKNEEGGWEQVHHYLARKENLVYSHGMCPSCLIDVRNKNLPAQ